MLQSMRNKIKGFVAIFLVALLTIPLALVGVESLFYGNQSVSEVAEVNGQKITEREMQLALGRERQRLQSQFGDNLPPDFLSDERLRRPVLEGLIRRALIAHVANEGQMTFSDAEIDKTIVELPEFQVEGRFDSQRFVQLVRNLGHSPASFRDLLREDMAINQMQNALLATDFITDKDVKRAVALSRQTRTFSWVTLPLADLPSTIDVTEEEIVASYETNKQSYLTEEQVAVEYISLSVSDLEKEITITEELVRAQFEQELNSFSREVQREVAHIMIEGDDEAAQQKIQTVSEKLAAGEDFAAIAEELSDDFGSRDNGGNLGLVEVGLGVFPDEFETALLDLTEGQVSEPVTVDNATHFIKLVTLTQDAPPVFEQEKERIENSLKRIRAEEQFVLDTEALSERSYNAENLEEVASELGVALGKTGLFSRAGGEETILQDSRIINAAFSERVLQEGFSSDVIELAPDNVVVVKKIDYQPVRTLTLEEKRDELVATLKEEKAKAQLAEQAASIRQSLDNGSSLETVSEENNLVISTQTSAGRNAVDVPEELLAYIFEMPKPEDDAIRIGELHLENGDYVLASLSLVEDGDTEKLTDDERNSLRANLNSSLSGDNYRAWQALLRARADIDIYNSQAPTI